MAWGLLHCSRQCSSAALRVPAVSACRLSVCCAHDGSADWSFAGPCLQYLRDARARDGVAVCNGVERPADLIPPVPVLNLGAAPAHQYPFSTWEQHQPRSALCVRVRVRVRACACAGLACKLLAAPRTPPHAPGRPLGACDPRRARCRRPSGSGIRTWYSWPPRPAPRSGAARPCPRPNMRQCGKHDAGRKQLSWTAPRLSAAVRRGSTCPIAQKAEDSPHTCPPRCSWRRHMSWRQPAGGAPPPPTTPGMFAPAREFPNSSMRSQSEKGRSEGRGSSATGLVYDAGALRLVVCHVHGQRLAELSLALAPLDPLCEPGTPARGP